MADRFVDTQLATGANNGSSMDDAWQSIKTAMEFSLADGDIVWIRRRSDNGIDDINPIADGTNAERVSTIGWPRTTTTISGTVEKGERVVWGVSPTPDWDKHVGRYWVKDGITYLISALILRIDYDAEVAPFTVGNTAGNGTGNAGRIWRIVDNGAEGILYIVLREGTFPDDTLIEEYGNPTGEATVKGATYVDGFLLDRPYLGDTEVDVSITLSADEDYDLAQVIDDSGWTIKKADWNADSDALVLFDWGADTGNLTFGYDRFWTLHNLSFKRTASSYNAVDVTGDSGAFEIIGCLFKTNIGFRVSNFQYGRATLKRIVHIGSFSLSGVYGTRCWIENCAFYSHWWSGGNSILYNPSVYLKNVSFDIVQSRFPNPYCHGLVRGIDVLMIDGLDPTYIGKCPYIYYHSGRVEIENYQKIFGNHLTAYYGGKISKVQAGTGSYPDQRSGGAEYIIEIATEDAATKGFPMNQPVKIFEHEIIVKATAAYRYYVQIADVATTNGLFIEIEYVNKYTNELQYSRITIRSDESCALRTGVGDWSQYVEVTDITPAVESTLRIKGYLSSLVNNHIFIDPKVEIV